MSPCPVQWTRYHRGELRGFTIVEIMIVVIILGILAALVMPRYTQASLESKAAAALAICQAVQQKIIEYRAVNGSYPATIDPEWFVGKALPKSPFEPDRGPEIDYVTLADTVKHPAVKIISDTNEPFWYNATNGVFRARVARETPLSKIVVTYNKANGTSVTKFTQTQD